MVNFSGSPPHRELAEIDAYLVVAQAQPGGRLADDHSSISGVVSTAANPQPGVRMFVVWPWYNLAANNSTPASDAKQRTSALRDWPPCTIRMLGGAKACAM